MQATAITKFSQQGRKLLQNDVVLFQIPSSSLLAHISMLFGKALLGIKRG
jgi:hypothetical protein